MERATLSHPIEMRENYISWGAIFAGTILSLIFAFFLNVLGLGLGFIAFEVDTHVLANLGIGSLVWFAISGIISAFLGGWIAGNVVATPLTLKCGALHGLLTWSIANIFTMLLTISAFGALGSGLFHLFGLGFGAAGQGALWAGKNIIQEAPQIGKVATDMFPELGQAAEKIKQQAKQIVTETREGLENLNDSSKDQILETVTAWFQEDSKENIDKARQKTIDLLIQYGNKNQAQAEQIVNDWQQKYAHVKEEAKQKASQIKQEAIQVIEPAAHISGAVIISLFFILLVGAIAGSCGGILGAQSYRR